MFNIAYSPPKKTTVIFSLILLLVGIILGILGFLGIASDTFPTLEFYGLQADDIFIFISFILSFVAWLLMYLGVKLRGF